MSGLFIPTYGQPAKEQQTPRGSKKSRRELPSKSTYACSSSKRSLMPSLVFNGNIEYVQVSTTAGVVSRGRCELYCFARDHDVRLHFDVFSIEPSTFTFPVSRIIHEHAVQICCPRIREFAPTGNIAWADLRAGANCVVEGALALQIATLAPYEYSRTGSNVDVRCRSTSPLFETLTTDFRFKFSSTVVASSTWSWLPPSFKS